MQRVRVISLALCAAVLAAGCASRPRRVRPPTVPATRPSLRDTTRPTSRPAVHVSDVQVQPLPEQTYFYVRTRTTFENVEQAVDGALAALAQAAADGRVAFAGPPTFVYLGATAELKRPFTLDVGFPVAAGARPFGRFRVRTLPPLRAATVTYTGPASLIDKAYDRLVPAMEAAGHQPADETREVYLEWDGPESERNRALVGIGLR